jgi:hypothetical protein
MKNWVVISHPWNWKKYKNKGRKSSLYLCFKKNSLYIFLHSCPNPPSPSQIACAYETLPSRCLGFVALACRRPLVPMRSVLDYSPSQCGCASQRDRQSGSHQHTVLQDARARGMLRSLECKYVPRHAPVRRRSRGQVSGKSATWLGERRRVEGGWDDVETWALGAGVSVLVRF